MHRKPITVAHFDASSFAKLHRFDLATKNRLIVANQPCSLLKHCHSLIVSNALMHAT